MHFHSEIVEFKWYYVSCLQTWKPAGELSSLHIYLSHAILSLIVLLPKNWKFNHLPIPSWSSHLSWRRSRHDSTHRGCRCHSFHLCLSTNKNWKSSWLPGIQNSARWFGLMHSWRATLWIGHSCLVLKSAHPQTYNIMSCTFLRCVSTIDWVSP